MAQSPSLTARQARISVALATVVALTFTPAWASSPAVAGQAVPPSTTILAEYTTETNQVVANSDGTLTLTSYRQPVRVRTSQGWTPVDTTLRIGKDGRVRPGATSMPMSFSGGGDAALASTTHGDHSFSLIWPTPLPEPTLDRNTATYAEVLPGVDLVITAQADVYRHVLVVKTPDAARNPKLATVAMTLDSINLRAQRNADNSLTFTDPKTGLDIFYASPPEAWDSSANAGLGAPGTAADPGGSTLRPVTSTLDLNTTARTAPGTEQATLTLIPDPKSLTSADLTYPLYIDPGYTQDRVDYLRLRSNGASHWNDGQQLRIGNCGWTGCIPIGHVVRSYFNFDVSQMWARNGNNPIVTTASVQATQVHNAYGCVPTAFNLASVPSGIHSGLSWPGPAYTTLAQATSNAGGSTACPAATVVLTNEAIRQYVESSAILQKAATFALISPNEADRYLWKRFDNNPKLEVTYYYRPNPPTGTAITNPTTCTVNGSAKTYAKSNVVGFTTTAIDNNPQPLDLNYYYTIRKKNTAGQYDPYISGWAPAQTQYQASGTTATWNTALPDGDYSVVTNSHSTADLWSLGLSNLFYFSLDRATPITPTLDNATTANPLIFTVGNAAGLAYSYTGSIQNPTNVCASQSFNSMSGYQIAVNGKVTINRPPGQLLITVKPYSRSGTTPDTATNIDLD